MPGESGHAARERHHRNKLAIASYRLWAYDTCSVCGMARVNVVHEQDPATAPEGPGYFADFLDELHPFVE